MKDRRQAGQIDVIEAVDPRDRQYLARNYAARNDKNFLRCRAFFSRWGGLRPLSIKNHFARTPTMTASTLAKIGAACIVLMTWPPAPTPSKASAGTRPAPSTRRNRPARRWQRLLSSTYRHCCIRLQGSQPDGTFRADQAPAARLLCLRFMKSLAVSTATAASRQ